MISLLTENIEEEKDDDNDRDHAEVQQRPQGPISNSEVMVMLDSCLSWLLFQPEVALKNRLL